MYPFLLDELSLLSGCESSISEILFRKQHRIHNSREILAYLGAGFKDKVISNCISLLIPFSFG